VEERCNKFFSLYCECIFEQLTEIASANVWYSAEELTKDLERMRKYVIQGYRKVLSQEQLRVLDITTNSLEQSLERAIKPLREASLSKNQKRVKSLFKPVWEGFPSDADIALQQKKWKKTAEIAAENLQLAVQELSVQIELQMEQNVIQALRPGINRILKANRELELPLITDTTFKKRAVLGGAAGVLSAAVGVATIGFGVPFSAMVAGSAGTGLNAMRNQEQEAVQRQGVACRNMAILFYKQRSLCAFRVQLATRFLVCLDSCWHGKNQPHDLSLRHIKHLLARIESLLFRVPIGL
jgi:hypothetical protein